MGYQHGLAEPGQPRHHDPGDFGQPDHDRWESSDHPIHPGVQGGRGQAIQVDPGRRQERIVVQAAEPHEARAVPEIYWSSWMVAPAHC